MNHQNLQRDTVKALDSHKNLKINEENELNEMKKKFLK